MPMCETLWKKYAEGRIKSPIQLSYIVCATVYHETK